MDETGANTFVVKNETSTGAGDIVTFIVPGGTPSRRPADRQATAVDLQQVMGRRGRGGVRWALVLAPAVAIVALQVPVSRADGDPASDMLLELSVFFPYNAPSQSARLALQQAVGRAYAQGNRVRVALIYDQTDLGSIQSLFGHPADYAQFLGIELGHWYVGPLLVVMPDGFGIYDGGRSTRSVEEAILRPLRIDTTSPDGLTQSATTAVQHLIAASALDSTDIRAPLVTAYPASAHRGRPAHLRFDVFDDSARSSAVVRVYESGALVATLATQMRLQIRHTPCRGDMARAEAPAQPPTALLCRRLRPGRQSKSAHMRAVPPRDIDPSISKAAALPQSSEAGCRSPQNAPDKNRTCAHGLGNRCSIH